VPQTTAGAERRAAEDAGASGTSSGAGTGTSGGAAASEAVTQAAALPDADPGSSQVPEVFGDPVLDTLVTTPEAVFVATPKGTMAHHRDCVVVAGKTGLRQVTRADGLIPCKLCAPYDA
jgi:hypothetical protein